MGFDPVSIGIMAAVVGTGAMSAMGSISAGKAESKSLRRQGEYNAQVYEQQAEMVNQQKRLQEYQDNRAAAKLRGAVKAKIGGSGFDYGGSPLAVMVDNETQMELDKKIGQYNYDVQSTFLRNQSSFTRYQYGENARLAKATGYSNAFKTIMGTAVFAAGIGFGAGMFGGAGGAAGNSGQAYNSMFGSTRSFGGSALTF